MRLKEIAIGILSAVVLFGSIEAGFRLFVLDPSTYRNLSENLYRAGHQHRQLEEPEFFDLDADLLWKFKPGLETELTEPRSGRKFKFLTDESGFRREEVEVRPGAQEFVLLSLGDSCTAGLEVETTYTKTLAKLIMENNSGITVKVINAGTSGYTSEQGVRQLDQLIARGVRPNLAVVHFGHNDSSMGMEGLGDRVLNLPTLYSFRLRRYLTHSYFAVWIYDKMMARLPAKFTHVARVSPSDYRQNLEHIVSRLKELGARVVIVDSMTTSPEDGYALSGLAERGHRVLAPYNHVMGEVASALNVELIKVSELAVRFGNRQFFADPDHDTVHPSEFGHQEIARQVVLTESLIPSGSDAR